MGLETPVEMSAAAPEVQALVERSRKAQAQIEHYTQAQVDELITTMVWSVARPEVAETIARHTIEETALGNYEGKYLKIFRKTRATLFDIIGDKSVGIIEEDKEQPAFMSGSKTFFSGLINFAVSAIK